jgi:hypothetical protein
MTMSATLIGARAAWDRFWFSPEPARNLAAARIVLSAQALWILLSRDIPALSGLPAAFWSDVPASARWRFLIFEGRPGLEAALQAVALLALTLALLGIAARASCLVAALLLYHLAPLETLFFTPSPWAKGLTLPVLGLLTLSLSPCADALRVGPRRPGAVAAGADHGWPLRVVQLFVCQPYLFSGIAKLKAAGMAWASPDNIRAWLLLANQDKELAVFRAPGLWLADRPVLCLAMGIAALAMDLGFIVALFSKRSRTVILPAAVLFHAAILVTQNYAFLSAPLLLVFVDWSRVSRSTKPSRQARRQPPGTRSIDPGLAAWGSGR